MDTKCVDFKSEQWMRMSPVEKAAELGRGFEQLESDLYLIAEFAADSENRVLEVAVLTTVFQLQVVEKLLFEQERIERNNRKQPGELDSPALPNQEH